MKLKQMGVLSIALMSFTNAIAQKIYNADKAAGYLFAYFEGSGDKNTQEQLRFAVSQDAQNWVALNNNKPILSSADISQTGGIRDPHILRGEDKK